MQEKSIINALLHVRAQIIRDRLDGLDHVNALLVARGVVPEAQHVPRKLAQRRDTARLALDALRSGPKRSSEVAAHAMAAAGLSEQKAKAIMYQALYNLHRRGLVAQDGKVWRLSSDKVAA
ncbi:hypothetical protein GEU84_001075 [Fertoebacter nigrum]|uniref:Uncharacterized protein n=1 Tax=Fertoeibacter niger TaxID=2656921 RepID=A0A8X8KJ91_9RHOB|nr:hypothetical protein [Fertoeibacter niger]NUB42964.1 hypothetical protein [Fertoeibacter niger]